MSLKLHRPTTSSRRGLILVDRSRLWKGKPYKALTTGLSQTGGRNAKGRMTSRHRGGGHKRLYRFIDFKRHNQNQGTATVERIEYDPNRTAFIALLRHEDQKRSYILAPEKVSPGDTILSGPHVDIKPGYALPLKNIPVGTLVHNVEMKIGKGAQIARAAGTSVQIAGRDGSYVLLRLPSGELRRIHGDCYASVGVLSNADHKNISLAKAGRNRWKGKRPHVRGVAMNPIDHPHGGGEGKTSGGRHPVSPWGQPTKGFKTRNNKRTASFIVRRRKA